MNGLDWIEMLIGVNIVELVQIKGLDIFRNLAATKLRPIKPNNIVM